MYPMVFQHSGAQDFDLGGEVKPSPKVKPSPQVKILRRARGRMDRFERRCSREPLGNL